MGRVRVHRMQDCSASLSLRCSTCDRLIGLGMTYLRVIILEADDDGVLMEIKRLTLCVWCSGPYRKKHR